VCQVLADTTDTNTNAACMHTGCTRHKSTADITYLTSYITYLISWYWVAYEEYMPIPQT